MYVCMNVDAGTVGYRWWVGRCAYLIYIYCKYSLEAQGTTVIIYRESMYDLPSLFINS